LETRWPGFFYGQVLSVTRPTILCERDTDIGVFQSNLDPATTTEPLDGDSDNDGWLDGQGDIDHNGRVDAGEKDPNRHNAKVLPYIPLLMLLDNE
jgi:hypothetical protein